VKVEIQEHNDNIGSDNYNQKLSLKRAETVRNFLIAKGIAADRLTTVGFGNPFLITLTLSKVTDPFRLITKTLSLKIHFNT
jgi:outer membrane protein OmpA-like peptidoglycan-associated protein